MDINYITNNWKKIMGYIEKEYKVSNAAINSWIKPMRVWKVIDQTVIIKLNERFDARGLQFIQMKGYDRILEDAINELFHENIKVSIELDDACMEGIVKGKLHEGTNQSKESKN